MGVGSVFLLVVLAIVVIGAIVLAWGIRAGLWASETSPKGEPNGEERFDRPEHTTVDEPGRQDYTPHR